jgi:phenylpropionate dioxygenase-like ring-hydroxylating dioxygenase large terminal subunit
MGDPDKADVTKIVDYPYHNDSVNWPHKHDMIHIKANYMLLVDNLMDLTHIGYVHDKTIGGDQVAHAQAKMKMTPTDNGLTFVRWMLDSVPPPTYAKAIPFRGRIDRWQEFQYIVPGNVLQWSGALEVGRGAYENRHQQGAFSIRLFHSMTPETGSTCFYFWSGANGYRQDDPVATEELFSELARTFAEDKVIVEGQQARLDERGETGLLEIASDAARVHMRRTVQRIIAEEARMTSAVEQVARPT